MSKAKWKAPTNICKISFLNKNEKFINVPYLFHDPSVRSCSPTDDPAAIYSLTNPLKSKIFNFNKLVSNLNVKIFLQDNTILPFGLASSGFIDKDHRHVVAGDLLIVGNNKLRKLFGKDQKYKKKTIVCQGKKRWIDYNWGT